MTNLAFDDFIEQHSKEPKINWDAKKAEWITYLSEFYSKIESILTPYINSGKLKLNRRNIELKEEYIGSYQVEALDIILGNIKIVLIPIGTHIIGAKGRVDMEGPKGIVRFVLVPKEADNPKIDIQINDGHTPLKPEVTDWVWKISTPPPRISYIELEDESFQTALMEVVNA